VRVKTFLFMPFKSRAGELVVGAQFGYDKRAVETLKLAMREARKQRSATPVGGWLEKSKCWFFERDAWPLVVEEWSKLWPIEIYEGPILDGIPHYTAFAFTKDEFPQRPKPSQTSERDAELSEAREFVRALELDGVTLGLSEDAESVAWQARLGVMNTSRIRLLRYYKPEIVQILTEREQEAKRVVVETPSPPIETLPPWLALHDDGDDDLFTPIARRYER
jgi:hypothetical protein